MEEKERYEIHMYDDCCVDLYDNGVLDKSITDQWELEKLLNYQDREINRLTKMLYTTTKHADKLNEENNKLKKFVNKLKRYIERLYQILLNSGEQGLIGLIAMILNRITELEEQLWKKKDMN